MWLLLFAVQLTVTVLVAYWVYALDDVPNAALASLQGTSGGKYEGKLGASALSEVEGFVCQTYRQCCRDPILDLALGGGGDEAGDFEAGSGGSGDSGDSGGSGDGAAYVSNRTCVSAHEGTTSDVAIALEDPSSDTNPHP